MRASIQLGCAPIVVCARRPEQAEKLVALRRDGEPEIVVARTAAEAAAAAPRLVLQATPAGAAGEKPVFDFASLPTESTVLEMIVSPTRTANSGDALRAGHAVVTGAAMLLWQAMEQVRLVTGGGPHMKAMLDAAGPALRRLGRTVVLVGLRCSGKTEIGSRLARILGRSFVDSDREVEDVAGISPDAMIRAGRVDEFRRIEAGALRDLLSRPGAVVATGGGAALHENALVAAAQSGPIVFLDADDETLLARWTATPRAPLSDLSPADELRRQRVERVSLYRHCAWVEIDTSRGSLDDLADLIAELDDADWRDASPRSGRPPRLSL